MSEVQDKKWYVVRAISGQENKIKTFIDNEVNRLNLKSFVEEVIVPTQKVIQIRNGKKVSCLLYTSPSPRDKTVSRIPSSA